MADVRKCDTGMIDINGLESFTCRGCSQVTQRAVIRGVPYTGAYCSAECLHGSEVREALRSVIWWIVGFKTSLDDPQIYKQVTSARTGNAAVERARTWAATSAGVPGDTLVLVSVICVSE